MNKIIENFDNKLLCRRELKIIIEHQSIPTMNEAKEIFAKEFNASEENIIIKSIKGKFGRKTFLISAMIYNTSKDKDEIEIKSRKSRREAKKTEKIGQVEGGTK